MWENCCKWRDLNKKWVKMKGDGFLSSKKSMISLHIRRNENGIAFMIDASRLANVGRLIRYNNSGTSLRIMFFMITMIGELLM